MRELAIAIVGTQSAGGCSEDPLSELALEWLAHSESSGNAREARQAISLALFERIVLPICKGRKLSDNAQEGYLALVAALETWKPEIGPFGPYARTLVKRGIRRSWNSLRYPVSIPYAVAQGKARIAKGIEVDSEIEKACEFFDLAHSTLGEFDSAIPDNRESENPETAVSGIEISALIREIVSEESVLSDFFGIHGRKIHHGEISRTMRISRARLYQIVQSELNNLRHALKSYNLAE